MAELSAKERRTVLEEIENALKAEGWRFVREPRIGTAKPDLLIKSPKGRFYIAEVKLTRGSEHFASVAEVSAMQAALARPYVQDAIPALAFFAPVLVIPLLISAGSISSSLRNAAKKLDVETLTIDPDNAHESARALVRKIQQLEMGT